MQPCVEPLKRKPFYLRGLNCVERYLFTLTRTLFSKFIYFAFSDFKIFKL